MTEPTGPAFVFEAFRGENKVYTSAIPGGSPVISGSTWAPEKPPVGTVAHAYIDGVTWRRRMLSAGHLVDEDAVTGKSYEWRRLVPIDRDAPEEIEESPVDELDEAKVGDVVVVGESSFVKVSEKVWVRLGHTQTLVRLGRTVVPTLLTSELKAERDKEEGS